jgi:hypothetical protein
MTVTPAVSRHTFFSLHFSPDIDIILSDVSTIDFSKLQEDIKKKNKNIIVNNCLQINLEHGIITIKGAIINGKYITLDSCKEYLLIDIDCSHDKIYICLDYLWHLRDSDTL